MSYASASLLEALRVARLAKGLSQAKLGKRVGLPQSHISKIEKGGSDIKLSSLVEIARALDLEVKLVPRSALPAVNTLVKASRPEEADATSRAVDRIHRAQQVAERVAKLQLPTHSLSQFQRTLAFLERQKFDYSRLTDLTRALQPVERLQRQLDEINAPLRNISEVSTFSRRLRDSGRSLENLREAIEKVPLAPLALPAYRLDEDDDA